MTVNDHMTHIEDSILNAGVDGTRRAILALNDIGYGLNGAGYTSHLTIKWDGAPSVFAGTDPSDGRFFVATKSIFNKTPKVYKSVADIEADTDGDLSEKLKMCFEHFPKLTIQGVIQGDLLYTKKDLKTIEIDGTTHVAFHPNTIAYAVPESSEEGQRILQSELGVVWHTTYRGDSFESMQSSVESTIQNRLRPTKSIWQVSPEYGRLPMWTEDESVEFFSKMSAAGRLFRSISSNAFNDIGSNPERLMRFKAFVNSRIRVGEPIADTSKAVNDMIEYVYNFYEKQVQQRKTEKGKQVQYDKLWDVYQYFVDVDREELQRIFDLYNLIIEAKHMVVHKLSQSERVSTMLMTSDGYVPTYHEGFVITHRDKTFKLIDRLEFSYANFSDHAIKGWDHSRANP